MSVIEVTEANFEDVVLNEFTVPVVVECGAEWCQPCKVMAPMLEALAAKRTDVKICMLDVDECTNICKTYKVRGAPTFLIFKDGALKTTHSGTLTEAKLLALL